MKIKRNLHPIDSIPVQRVFRVDDEIEVVVQDVDLRKKSRILTKQLKKSIEQVWNRNPEWLGTLKPLALAGRNGASNANGRKSDTWHALAYKKEREAERGSKSVCVTLPVSIDRSRTNGTSHVANYTHVMTDSIPTLGMTPPNEELATDPEQTFGKADGDSLDTMDLVSNILDCPNIDDSPCSVIEVPVEKNIPLIDIEDPSDVNGNETCHGEHDDRSADLVDDVKVDSEVPVRVMQPRRKNRLLKDSGRRNGRSELEKLYVSLKEIPWAQNWSPKTFLSRNTKDTFPKRETTRINRSAIKETEAVKNSVVISRPLNVQKGKAKQLVTKAKAKTKTKTGGKLTEMKIPQKTLLDKKRKTLAALGICGEPTRAQKNSLSKCIRMNEKQLSATLGMSGTSSGKGGPTHKLSTDLAIKQYDASKLSKMRNSPKRKFAVHYEMNGCSSTTKSSTGVACKLLPNSKLGPLYSKVSPSISASAQVAVSMPYRKDNPKPNCFLEDPKPLVAVSPKILPFSSTPDYNGFSAVRTEAAGGGVLGSSSGGSSESRLGNEQLLQRQLVSVLGKENAEAKKRKLEDESLRYSVRQSECAFRYKEIAVKKHSNYIQIILVPNRTRHNGLTLEALHELREALISAKKDPTCKVLLLNSSGSIFCSGIDLASLVGQIHTPHKISQAVRSLIETLALFSKPVVAAVNGAAVGLGVTLLTYCDVVFASEKATFFTPYARLGHIPEGAMTLVLPQVVGSLVASDMLLRDRKLTAFQASIYGLVSEVIWPSQFMESVIPRVQAMANQSGQAMESTKVLLRYHQWDKLQSTLENESRLLPKQWLSVSCQQALKQALEQPGGLVDW